MCLVKEKLQRISAILEHREKPEPGILENRKQGFGTYMELEE
jgi:hypothetical protein